MASSVTIRTSAVTREKLAQVLGNNQVLIRLLEGLVSDVTVNIPAATDALQFVTEDSAAAVDLAQALAHAALALANMANEGPPPLPVTLPDIPEDMTARVCALDAWLASSLADLRSAWTSYTPTVTSQSGAISALGTVSARYKTIGKTMFWSALVAITTNGTGATWVNISLPPGVTAASIGALVAGREDGMAGKMLQGRVTAGQGTVVVVNYDNSYPGGDGYRLLLEGVIEIA